MCADVVQIVMFEASEASRMKMYQDYDNLCIAHTVGFATVFFCHLIFYATYQCTVVQK